MSPIYEYECENHHRFETLRPFDSDPSQCPLCGGKIRRLFSKLMRIKTKEEFYKTHKPDTRVRGESGMLGQRVSETDKSNIDEQTPTRVDSKGRPHATPTRLRLT